VIKKFKRCVLVLLGILIGMSQNPYEMGLAAAPEVQGLKAIYEAGMKSMSVGQYDAAITYFKKILKINPKMAPIHNLLGVAYLKQNSSIIMAKLYGAKIGEVPVNMRKRLGGISSIRYLNTLYYMLKVTLAILIDTLKKRT